MDLSLNADELTVRKVFADIFAKERRSPGSGLPSPWVSMPTSGRR